MRTRRIGDHGLPTEVTLVWFSLDTIVIGGVAVFIAGFLIGLCCGSLRYTGRDHDRGSSSSFATPRRSGST
jgi:hypothetical protein